MRRKKGDDQSAINQSLGKVCNHSDESSELESQQDSSELLLDASVLIGSSISALSPTSRHAAAAIDPLVATSGCIPVLTQPPTD